MCTHGGCRRWRRVSTLASSRAAGVVQKRECCAPLKARVWCARFQSCGDVAEALHATLVKVLAYGPRAGGHAVPA
eukprot:361578-Chlamydomonas_euryale.AAC.7